MRKQHRKTRELIIEGVKESVARALERHKKLGESVAVWKDGRVVMLKPDNCSFSEPLGADPHVGWCGRALRGMPDAPMPIVNVLILMSRFEEEGRVPSSSLQP